MSDDVVGSCCALAFAACYDVCLGICIDFLSVRECDFPPFHDHESNANSLVDRSRLHRNVVLM